MQIVCGGVTDVGRVRSNNEDCFRIVTPLNLYVLADGMGGEAHGEIASALAVETVVKHCLDAEANPAAKVLGQVQPGWSAETKRLSTALHLANRNICKSAEEHPEQRGPTHCESPCPRKSSATVRPGKSGASRSNEPA